MGRLSIHKPLWAKRNLVVVIFSGLIVFRAACKRRELTVGEERAVKGPRYNLLGWPVRVAFYYRQVH